MPPILVPNVDDKEELAYHIRNMFYITAGVATLLFLLVVFGKMLCGLKGFNPLKYPSNPAAVLDLS